MNEKITALILSGGRGSRMDGVDKGLVQLNGTPLIEHVFARLRPQVDHFLISANRNLDEYQKFGVPVLPDDDDSFAGPLAGIAQGMRTAQTERLLVVPCDMPFLPTTLVARLTETLEQNEADLAVVEDPNHFQALCFLTNCSLLHSVEEALKRGEPKVRVWQKSQKMARCFFDDPAAFANLNTPEELETSLKNTEISKISETQNR